jgi:hypothetical protein
MTEVELKEKIVEREDIIRYFLKYQMPFDYKGFKIICKELADWKIELAKIESQNYELNRRLITSN